MKILVIPDLHGSNIWKPMINEPHDLCVFLGDYCDSFTYSNEYIINNLLDIIQYKKDNFEKVVLLLGNHELPYIYLNDRRFKCSGHRPEIDFTLNYIFRENKDLFLNAFQVDNFIFTHAGIQHNWFIQEFKGNLNENIAKQLNNPRNREQLNALYYVGLKRRGFGSLDRHNVGGIFWCDKDELKKPLKGYIQVVGHTHINKLVMQKRKDSIILFCDYLHYTYADEVDEPLIIDTNDKIYLLLC